VVTLVQFCKLNPCRDLFRGPAHGEIAFASSILKSKINREQRFGKRRGRDSMKEKKRKELAGLEFEKIAHAKHTLTRRPGIGGILLGREVRREGRTYATQASSWA